MYPDSIFTDIKKWMPVCAWVCLAWIFHGSSPTRARVLGMARTPFILFPIPQGGWEQNIGNRPQQVVNTCSGEKRAEHHDDSWKRKKEKRFIQILEEGRTNTGEHRMALFYWKPNYFTSSVDYFLPGLGFQHFFMGIEVLADHKRDHGHCYDPQHGHVTPWKQRGTSHDGRGVDAGQATVHERDPWWPQRNKSPVRPLDNKVEVQWQSSNHQNNST